MRNDLPSRFHSYALLAIGLIAMWLASGCAGEPRVVYRTVEVQVPVATPCLSALDIPLLPGPLPTMPQDANAALSLSLAQNFRWTAYGFEADGLLRACAGLSGVSFFTSPGIVTGQAAGPLEPYLLEIPGGYQLVTH